MSEFIGLNKEFYRELQEEIDSAKIAIMSGRISSFDEYKRLVGRLSGLEFALDRHKQLTLNLEEALLDGR